MAWELAEKNFPQEIVVAPNNDIFTIEDLHKNNLNVISSIMVYYARNMVWKEEEWAWGKDGEFGIGTKYDALQISSKATGVSPLNVYGATMLYDYINLNQIDLDKNKETSKEVI